MTVISIAFCLMTIDIAIAADAFQRHMPAKHLLCSIAILIQIGSIQLTSRNCSCRLIVFAIGRNALTNLYLIEIELLTAVNNISYLSA